MTAIAAGPVTVRQLGGFDDLHPDQWRALLDRGDTRVGYLTWEFQRAWWETLGLGELLLLAAERDGSIVALAPFFVEESMVSFVGTSFEFDYLDFVGDASDPDVVESLLRAALDYLPRLLGFRLYFLPTHSRTFPALEEVGRRLDLESFVEHEMAAAEIDLVGDRERALTAVSRKSVLKAERWFQRHGLLTVRHTTDPEEILRYLPDLVAQHRARHPGPQTPSRFFYDNAVRLFERITVRGADTGYLRFTHLEWDRKPLALHYGHVYGGRYFWGVSSFAPELASHSPGRVLLRHLLLAAIEEGAHTFDFGTGGHAFQLQVASRVTRVCTVGLYPAEDGQTDI